MSMVIVLLLLVNIKTSHLSWNGCTGNQHDKVGEMQPPWMEYNWNVSNMMGIVLLLKFSINWLAKNT